MARVEPVPGEPAATARLDGERALVVADYHAGIEAGLRYERGVELRSDAAGRRERVVALLDRTESDRLVVLGDLAHRIGDPRGVEREELAALVEAVTDRVPMTVVRGNHDGGLAGSLDGDVTVTPAGGTRLGAVGFAHGHTWPSSAALEGEVLCVGHEHPTVRLEDEIGGYRVERAWLRGRLDPEPFEANLSESPDWHRDGPPELVVFPAFNDRSGGTWINVVGEEFLSPFLPAGLADGEAYLLDGTRLGAYEHA